MRIPRIYQAGEFNTGTAINLDADAFLHVVKVLRLKIGAPLILFNGKGAIFSATLIEADKKHCKVQLQTQQLQAAPTIKIHLAQAIIKPDKMDLIIQKAVELGATHITPLISAHCDVKLNSASLEKKHLHWQKIMIQACEQAGVNHLPQLLPIQMFQHWTQAKNADVCVILDPNAEKTLSMLPKNLSSLAITVGPEGGWSQQEAALALQQDLFSASLGPRILRAETAAIASLAICQSQLNF